MSFSWMDDAACANTDMSDDAWHPVTPNYSSDTIEALRLCRTCPVIDRCLVYALDENLEYGIYGGTTRDQRRQIRRERNSTPKVQVRKIDGAWTVSDGQQVARAGNVQIAWAFVRRLVAS